MTVPAIKSTNVTPEETMPMSKSPDLGSCTPCSIVLEDVVDLGLSPLGSVSPGCAAARKDDQEVPVKDNNDEVLDAYADLTSLARCATQAEEPICLTDTDDDNVTELMESAEASGSHERSQPGPQEDVVEQEEIVEQVDGEMRELPVVAMAEEVDVESDDDDWEPVACPGGPNQPRGGRADTRSCPVGRGRSFAQWAGTALPTPFTTSQTSIVDLPLSTQPSPLPRFGNSRLKFVLRLTRPSCCCPRGRCPRWPHGVPCHGRCPRGRCPRWPHGVPSRSLPQRPLSKMAPWCPLPRSLLQRPQYGMEISSPQLQRTLQWPRTLSLWKRPHPVAQL